jgi:hypothetical protein
MDALLEGARAYRAGDRTGGRWRSGPSAFVFVGSFLSNIGTWMQNVTLEPSPTS